MTDWWDKQIHRANHLAPQANGSKELLKFYAQLLRAQKDVYEFLRGCQSWLPSGDLECDLPMLLHAERLMMYWGNSSDIQFFEKAVLQPYLRWVADTGARPVGRAASASERFCPFCGGSPQVSFLQNKETTAESGNRDLICATCLSSWGFRRVVCANCGEERPAKLGYFHSPEFDHVRIEACDTCKHYIKGVDLTRAGFAAPIVDEIDAAPLDLWAREHGFTKIELNLVGV